MTFKDRYKSAMASYLTPVGRASILILMALLFYLPNTFINLNITDMIPGFWNNAITNTMITVFIVGGIAGSLVVLGFIYGIIMWIVTGTFDLSYYFDCMRYIYDHIGAVYKLVFGDYFKKWYFLKVIFRPKEVAKDLLLRGDNEH